MSIFYALISKNNDIVLCEYTEYSGNFQQITIMLLRKIKQNIKVTIEYDKYKYHYLNENGITFLCMTENYSDELSFSFLFDLKKIFFQKYNFENIKKYSAYELQDFNKIINQLLAYYTTLPKLSKSKDIINNFSEINNISFENIDNIFGRDEKINIFAIKEENLSNHTRNINFISEQIKSQLRVKKIKQIIIVIILLIIILFIIYCI
jgi:hypothetical protein